MLANAKVPENWPTLVLRSPSQNHYSFQFSANNSGQTFKYDIEMAYDPTTNQGIMDVSAHAPEGRARLHGSLQTKYSEKSGLYWLIGTGQWAKEALQFTSECIAIRAGKQAGLFNVKNSQVCLLDASCKSAVSCAFLKPE